MDAQLPTAGTYVVAVSGGVDSMALLHALQQNNPGSWQLIVAHVDHGIRQDAGLDRQLVQTTAAAYGLPFEFLEARLGPAASEAAAREARYAFLEEVRRRHNAAALVTAHHQDDMLETAIINLLRGTGRKGLSSLQSRPDVVRPLLHMPKSALIAYAQDQGLAWREDSTNSNEAYLRNYIRSRILPKFDAANRQQLLDIIAQSATTNNAIDQQIVAQLNAQSAAGTLDRIWFNQLPHAIAKEMMAGWLRAQGIRNFDKPTIERLVVVAKVSPKGKKYPINSGYFLEVEADILALKLVER